MWFLKPEHFDHARRCFNAHSAKSVFLGRFLPSIKAIAPFGAATVGVRQRIVVFWNVLGGLRLCEVCAGPFRLALDGEGQTVFPAGILMLLNGLRRIALGGRYLSDVWAGYLVGALWVIVGFIRSEWLIANGRISWQAPLKPRR